MDAQPTFVLRESLWWGGGGGGCIDDKVEVKLLLDP